MFWNNLKINKYHKYNLKKKTKRSKILNQGNFGLKALESSFLKDTELKMLYFFLRKYIKKKGKVWLFINPDYAHTKKPIQVRMGKGKGSYVGIYSKINCGKIFLEIYSPNKNFIKSVLKQLSYRLSIKVKLVSNRF